jgi:hypothetical protein
MSRTKDIVYASFPLLILLCLIYVPGIWLGGGKPTLHIEDLFILAGGVYGISRLKGMVPRILFSKPWRAFVVPYISFVGWLILITLINFINVQETYLLWGGFFKALSIMRPMCYVVLLLVCIRTYSSLRLLITGLKIIGIVQIPIFICQKFNIFEINVWLTPKFSLVYETSIYSIAGFRTDGTFGNPNFAAVAMVPIGALFYGYCLFGRGAIRKRLLSFVGAFSMLMALIFLTQSRAGVFGLGSAMLGLQLLAARQKPIRASLTIGILIIIVVLIVPKWLAINTTNEANISERFRVFSGLSFALQDYSLSGRIELWRERIEMLGSDIWLGRGFSSFSQGFFSDSGYVDYLCVGGVVSVILFVLMCIKGAAIFIPFIKSGVIKGDSTYVLATACALFGSMLVLAVSHPILYLDKAWLLYLTVIVAAFISIKISKLSAKEILEQDKNGNSIGKRPRGRWRHF